MKYIPAVRAPYSPNLSSTDYQIFFRTLSLFQTSGDHFSKKEISRDDPDVESALEGFSHAPGKFGFFIYLIFILFTFEAGITAYSRREPAIDYFD